MTKVRRVDYWPDEFIVGVSDLRHDEIGPYWVACSLMYSRGGAIPEDDIWLAAASRCGVKTWRAIKAALVEKGKIYRIVNRSSAEEKGIHSRFIEGSWVGPWLFNGRVHKELDRTMERLSRNRENGQLGGRSNKINDLTEANGLQSGEPRNSPARELPTTNYQPPTEEKKKESPPETFGLSAPKGGDGFDEFYAVYPRRVGKGAAKRAYPGALKKTSREVLLAGAKAAAAKFADRDPEFIPHPATWLNGERWLDEAPARPPPKKADWNF